MRARSLTYALVGLAMLVARAWSSPSQVGSIDHFEGPSRAFELRRGEQRMRFGVREPVFEGDVIVWRPDARGGRVWLDLGHPEMTVVGPDSSPYRVPAAAAARGRVSRLFGRARDVLTRLHDERVGTVAVLGRARAGDEDAPELPLLDGGPRVLRAGTRPLWIGWIGGKPPFEVRVGRSGEKAAERGTVAPSRRWRSPEMTLRPGPYVVTVADSDGAEARGRFKVVAPERMPGVAGCGDEARDGDAAIAAVFELTVEPDGVFAFEAAQCVGPVVETQYAAGLLWDELVAGGVPGDSGADVVGREGADAR